MQNTEENSKESCIFCRIITKEVPASIVYEDTETIAFLDIRPNNFGHTLVIPKDHFENIYTLPQESLCKVMLSVQKVALAVKKATQADGLSIIMNTEYACHMKDHAHVHIIPRNENDGIFEWPSKAYIGDEMEEMSEKITKEINN